MHYLPPAWQGEHHLGVWLEDALVLINLANPAERRLYEPTHSWRLMMPLGAGDCQDTPLYEADIVEWSARYWEIVYSPYRLGFVLVPLGVSRPAELPLNAALTRRLRCVGNRFEHPHLLETRPLRLAA